jgi:hypothetical protein
MIAACVVKEIQDMLRAGTLSQRKIARRMGVSRGTVTAIALGRRCDRPARKRTEEFDFPSGPPLRCPGCGGLVQMPCLLCRLRAMRQRARRPLERCADSDE